jgi:hypothetical protein
MSRAAERTSHQPRRPRRQRVWLTAILALAWLSPAAAGAQSF